MTDQSAFSSFTASKAGEIRKPGDMQGRVFLPQDPGYDEARLTWNRKTNQHPALIVEAAGVQDVIAAVRFARQQGLGIAVQGTGHGGVRPADGALLVLTRAMQGLEIDPAAQMARIEAGLKWGAVLAAAQEHGLAPLLGSSPTVGVVGFTLGGGLGWLGRKHGLAADNVLEFEVVTANGEPLRASENENPGLFWGLRGGGGSLGIVTRMTIRLFPVRQVYAGNLFYPASMAAEVFRRYRDWIERAPDELTSSVLVMNYPPLPQIPDPFRGQSFVIVRGCYCGPVPTGQALLNEWRAWHAPLIDAFGTIPFSQAASISQDPVDPVPALNTGAWVRTLNDSAIDTLIEYALGKDGRSPLAFVEVRHAGGAIGRVPSEAAALGNRDAALVLSIVAPAPTAEAAIQAADYAARLKAGLGEALSGGVYLNFVEGEEAQARITDALAPGGYRRLSQLKAQLDPDNLFRYSQNVQPQP